MIKSDEVTRKELINTIELFKLHPLSPGLAKKLIGYFHERMQEDEYVDSDLLYEFMKPVFASIMQGNTADQAFGLKLIKGKYEREGNYMRDLSAAAVVVLLMRKGVKWEDAINDASEYLGIGDRIIMRAYSHYKEEFEWIPDSALKMFLDDPLPS